VYRHTTAPGDFERGVADERRESLFGFSTLYEDFSLMGQHGGVALAAAGQSLNQGLRNVGTGIYMFAHDFWAVPYDGIRMLFDPDHRPISFLGQSIDAALAAGVPPGEIQLEVLKNVASFGLYGYYQSWQSYYETGDPAEFQKYSGSFLAANLLALAMVRAGGGGTRARVMAAEEGGLLPGRGPRGPSEVPTSRPVAEPPPACDAPVRTRLPQDINVNPVPPDALPLRRPIGQNATQNAALQADIAAAEAAGARNIRVNQQQVNAAGQRVGINRPDLQYTDANGRRVYVEYDTSTSTRGPGHRERILANDPEGTVILRTVD
jgi:hypothetical protein